MAIKYMITGLSNAGKTTLLKDLKDVFVVSVDGKKYPFEQPHTNIDNFDHIGELIQIVSEKINIYEEKFSKLPDIVAIDTASRILTMITDACNKKYTGFNVWTEANKQIQEFVRFVDSLVDADISVVIINHAVYDQDVKKYCEVCQGNFAKIGGFLSTMNFSSFIETKGNKRIIHHRNPNMMSRTLLEDVPDSQPIEEYDIQEYIDKIKQQSSKAYKWEL